MSKKTIKNVASFAVAATIIAQMIPGMVSAENYKQNRVVKDVFNTFTTYTLSKDENNNPVLPKGLK